MQAWEIVFRVVGKPGHQAKRAVVLLPNLRNHYLNTGQSADAVSVIRALPATWYNVELWGTGYTVGRITLTDLRCPEPSEANPTRLYPDPRGWPIEYDYHLGETIDQYGEVKA